MTWNVYMLPWPIKSSKQGPRSEVQAQELKKIQEDLDILVLNEAFTKRSRRNISNAVSEQLPYTARLPRKGGITKVMDSGVMVMSRYPMKVIGETYFKKCGRADCFASKGAIMVEVTAPDGKVSQIVATHMQSGKDEKYAKIRTTQFEQIKEMMARNARPGVPQILMGDLNLNENRPEEFANALKQLDMESPEISGDIKSTKSETTSCFGVDNTSNPKGWLDHVLINPQGSGSSLGNKSATPLRGVVNNMTCDLSDHLPVRAAVKIGNTLVSRPPPVDLEESENCEEINPIIPDAGNLSELLNIELPEIS